MKFQTELINILSKAQVSTSAYVLVLLVLFLYSILFLWTMFTIQVLLICTWGEQSRAPPGCPTPATTGKVHSLNLTTINTLTFHLSSHQNESVALHSKGSINPDKLQIFSHNYKLQSCVTCHYKCDQLTSTEHFSCTRHYNNSAVWIICELCETLPNFPTNIKRIILRTVQNLYRVNKRNIKH